MTPDHISEQQLIEVSRWQREALGAMEKRMSKIVINEKAYKPSPINKVIELKVTVMLDGVPGAWHEPEDIMNWIAKHSYVQQVELVEKDTTKEKKLVAAVKSVMKEARKAKPNPDTIYFLAEEALK